MAGAFKGPAEVSLVTRADVDNRPCTYEDRDACAPRTRTVPAGGRSFRFAFPPHSFTQVVVGVER